MSFVIGIFSYSDTRYNKCNTRKYLNTYLHCQLIDVVSIVSLITKSSKIEFRDGYSCYLNYHFMFVRRNWICHKVQSSSMKKEKRMK